MQLTRAADYAVRVVPIWPPAYGNGGLEGRSGEGLDAPESFVAKILQALTRAGLVEARRGVDGGFLLLERGVQASLLDVVESIDGPISLNVCLNAEVSCARASGCSAHQVWRQAQEAMLAVLREAKIAQMVQPNGCGGCAEPNLCISTSKPADGLPEATVPAGSLPPKEKRIAVPRWIPFGASRERNSKQ